MIIFAYMPDAAAPDYSNKNFTYPHLFLPEYLSIFYC